MDRRGFLGSLMAVTTAIAGGVKLPSSTQVSRAAPLALKTQNELMAILKECVAMSVSANSSASGPLTYTVEYVHLPKAKKTDDALVIDGYTKNLRPVSVQFFHGAGELPRVTVEWA